MTRITGTADDDILGGGDKKDALFGLGGNDLLIGYGGDDKIDGGAGNDTLVGWTGADELTGGAGADIFQISPSFDVMRNGWNYSPDRDGQRDKIMDFNSGEGDKIDLRGLVKHIDTNGDGASEQYPVTRADVEIEQLAANEYRVHVHQVSGDTTWDLGLDVVSETGVAPAETDFLF